jgi:hypothetical protein
LHTFGEGGFEVESVLEGGRKKVVSEEEPGVKVVVLKLQHWVKAFIGRVYSLNIGHYLII